jgi:hypothetical protein
MSNTTIMVSVEALIHTIRIRKTMVVTVIIKEIASSKATVSNTVVINMVLGLSTKCVKNNVRRTIRVLRGQQKQPWDHMELIQTGTMTLMQLIISQ